MARAAEPLGPAPPSLGLLLDLVLEAAWTPMAVRSPRGKVSAISQG